MNYIDYDYDEKGNKIHPTAQIYPGVFIGHNNYIGPYCIIGAPAERKGYSKQRRGVEIGDNNHITGLVTIDGGTERKTVVGSGNYIMKHVHLGHDVLLDNDVTLAPGVKVGGFCHLMKGVNCGMNTTIHPRQLIGPYAMLGMGCIVPKGKEIRPFGKYIQVAKWIGSNERGIEKANLTEKQVIELTNQYYEKTETAD